MPGCDTTGTDEETTDSNDPGGGPGGAGDNDDDDDDADTGVNVDNAANHIMLKSVAVLLMSAFMLF